MDCKWYILISNFSYLNRKFYLIFLRNQRASKQYRKYNKKYLLTHKRYEKFTDELEYNVSI